MRDQSPVIPVEPGTFIRIQGWVYVPDAIAGSLDGLLVLDSLGGEPLAERFGDTTGWKQFTAILPRPAPAPYSMTVTVALTGFGEAWMI